MNSFTKDCDCCGEDHENTIIPCDNCGEERVCMLENYQDWHLCDDCAENNNLCPECHCVIDDRAEFCDDDTPLRFDDPGPNEPVCGLLPKR